LQGAEDVRVLIGRPDEPDWAFRPAQDAAVPAGATVMVHLAASWERYWSQATRTYTAAAGRFNCNQAAEGMFRALTAKLTPGLPVADFARTAAHHTDAVFLRDYGLGHGIGTAPKEPPFLTPDCAGAIERGMCFAIHLALPDRAAGPVAHGGTFVVGASEKNLQC